ncbi:MAG: hypothetical protein ACXAB4_14330 [Candidatus Hodarchaeales archaeon]|jgi:hypothetical protein
MMELDDMGRRSDLELVETMISYLGGKIGVVTQGQLCATMRINSETAEKWLKILQLVKNQCPYFTIGKAGRFGIISIFGEEDDPAKETPKKLDRLGSDLSTFKAELEGNIVEGTAGLEKVSPADLKHQTSPASSIHGIEGSRLHDKGYSTFFKDFKEEMAEKMSEGLQEVSKADLRHRGSIVAPIEKVRVCLRCVECEAEQGWPVHCGEPMEFEEMAFSCLICGDQKPAITHCNKPMAIIVSE